MAAQFCEGAGHKHLDRPNKRLMETLHTFTVAYVPRGPSDMVDYPRESTSGNKPTTKSGESGVLTCKCHNHTTHSQMANTCHQHHINLLPVAPLAPNAHDPSEPLHQ